MPTRAIRSRPPPGASLKFPSGRQAAATVIGLLWPAASAAPQRTATAVRSLEQVIRFYNRRGDFRDEPETIDSRFLASEIGSRSDVRLCRPWGVQAPRSRCRRSTNC